MSTTTAPAATTTTTAHPTTTTTTVPPNYDFDFSPASINVNANGDNSISLSICPHDTALTNPWKVTTNCPDWIQIPSGSTPNANPNSIPMDCGILIDILPYYSNSWNRSGIITFERGPISHQITVTQAKATFNCTFTPSIKNVSKEATAYSYTVENITGTGVPDHWALNSQSLWFSITGGTVETDVQWKYAALNEAIEIVVPENLLYARQARIVTYANNGDVYQDNYLYQEADPNGFTFNPETLSLPAFPTAITINFTIDRTGSGGPYLWSIESFDSGVYITGSTANVLSGLHVADSAEVSFDPNYGPNTRTLTLKFSYGDAEDEIMQNKFLFIEQAVTP